MGISFTPLDEDHLPTLSEWLSEPHVKRWWPEPSDLTSVTSKYRPIIDGTDTTKAFVISHDDLPIGYIQSYRFVDEPQWRETVAVALEVSDAAGIDYLIGREESTRLGLGSEAIREFVATLWDQYEEISVVVVAVQQANVASWKALEKAGFHRAWGGLLASDDPSDRGPTYVYVKERGAD